MRRSKRATWHGGEQRREREREGGGGGLLWLSLWLSLCERLRKEWPSHHCCERASVFGKLEQLSCSKQCNSVRHSTAVSY
eukprot:COSAG06_NODE_31_length_31488_cov_60.882793_39_plen_80_part_00